MATRKARADESAGMVRYWNSPAGRARRAKMSASMKGGRIRTKSRGSSMPREYRKRRYSDKVHILPDSLGVLAVGTALLENVGNGSPVDDLRNGDLSAFVNTVATNLTSVEGWKKPALLAVAALGSKVVGKYLGLNRIGTKKVKLA